MGKKEKNPPSAARIVYFTPADRLEQLNINVWYLLWTRFSPLLQANVCKCSSLQEIGGNTTH